jgi:DNA-binding CsgD family transcriptional regulator
MGQAGRPQYRCGVGSRRRLDLSARERQVLVEMANGSHNAEIGRSLCISEETVKSHVRHIFARMGAKSRTHAVALAFQRGEIDLDEIRDARAF